MADMKKYLNKHSPNNIMNYMDSEKGFDKSYSDWYESDIRNAKNPIYSTVYGVILTKPKIGWWVQKKIFDVTYRLKGVLGRLRK